MNKNNTTGTHVAASELKMRVAASYTLAKTMLPGAPQTEVVKFARTLLANSTTALKVALRQTAINAHWTRVAESFASVHKVDLNDLLEDPSVLNKERSAVKQEFHTDPKSAATKVADDRKECGPLPNEYPEPKRNEPSELDGSNAGKGRPESWTEGPGSKEAGKKSASCGEGCKGCENCKKEAAAKVAEGEEPAKAEGEAAADQAAAEGAEAAAEGAEQVATEEKSEEAADAAPAEGEGEKFDPVIENLEQAAKDTEQANERLEEAIAELEDKPEDLTLPEGGEAEPGLEGDLGGDLGLDGGEALPEGEELNLDDIFDPEQMSDKVSALNDEGDDFDIEAALGDEGGDGELALIEDAEFFKPTDPAELEEVLENEEGLSSPADMFALKGIDTDPMKSLFASAKQAADTEIVEPGELVDFFEQKGHGTDSRDAETDHEGDLFDEIFNTLKQPERKDQRDTEPHLQTPKKEAASQAPIRTLRPTITEKTASPTRDLASLLFLDEDEYR